MNREDIIRMAREVGLPHWYETEGVVNEELLIKFAALVASAEREACIVDIQMHIPRSGRHTPEYQMAMRMLERILARGQA